MKNELLYNIRAIVHSLDGVDVSGKESVYRMRDAFLLLEGVEQYLLKLPDEQEQENNGGE